MARSEHATYTAVDRFERRAARRNRPTTRRETSRRAAKYAAILEAV